MNTVMIPQITEPKINEVEIAVEDIIELIVPPIVNPAQLFKFMCKFSDGFGDRENSYKSADIMHTHGNWKQGVVITMAVWPADFDKFMENISKLAMVRRIEETPLINLNFLGMPVRPDVLTPSMFPTKKRIHLALGEVVSKTQVSEPMLVAV
jgi:hypothetical protein